MTAASAPPMTAASDAVDASKTDDPSADAEKRDTRADLKRLLALAKPERNTLILATFFLAMSSAANLAFPQAIGVIIDSATGAEGGDTRLIDLAALAMVGLFAVQAVASGLRYYLFTIAGERILTTLRKTLYGRILSQEIAFFDTRRTGELLNRLASDTTVLQNAVSVNISMALRHFATVLGGIALLFYTSPTLTLLMLVVVPPVALGTVVFGRMIRKLSRKVQDALAEAGEIAEETLAGVRTVRAFTQEQGELARYGGAIDEAFNQSRHRIKATGVFIGGTMFAGYAAVALVLWYGGRLVLNTPMQVGDLTSFVLYTLLVAFSLGSLGGLWADFMRATGATERVFDLMDRIPTIPTQGGTRLDHVDGRVELDSVNFAYPSRPDVVVLKDISLTLNAGEVVALVGSSGGGKSTIAAMIARFYDPASGRILIDGTDARDLDPGWLREQIGSVAQEPILFSTTIADNIRYGRPDATPAEVEQAARVANAHDFIQHFPDGYNTEVGERGVQLSGGQKQRVAIARAVLKDPRILILDEATSALDAESEYLVKEALDRLMAGRTTLVIAHRLSTVKDADRVVVLDRGSVVQRGTHDALLEQDGLYQRLVSRQLDHG